ncbi:hypothetical protein GCM10027425_33480 [Alteromonas gracilis]
MTLVRSTLSRVVAVANGKGGAGKTSVATHLAGLSAAAGWRTLLIDLDPQGNAGHDLGYAWADLGDGGEHLVSTLTAGGVLAPVITECRPNLDVITGGPVLDDLEAVISSRGRRDARVYELLASALSPLAQDYDLVVLDTPPKSPVLLQQALVAARWILIPTKPDRGSIHGLSTLAETIGRVQELNPDLQILGAVLFDVEASATVVRRNAAEDITAALDGAAPLLDSVIRHAQSSAVLAREKGVLVHELAEEVDNAEPFWKALRDGRTPTRRPGSVGALADDWVLLVDQALRRIAELTDDTQEDSA